MVRALVIADNYNPKGGGAEKVFFEFQKELEQAGYEVFSMGFFNEEKKTKSSFVIKETSNALVRYYNRVFFNPLMYKKIRSYIEEVQPDVIYSYNINKYTISLLKAMKGYKVYQRINDYSWFCPSLWCVHEDNSICTTGYQKECGHRHRRGQNRIVFAILKYFFHKRNTLTKQLDATMVVATPLAKRYAKKQGFKKILFATYPVHMKPYEERFDEIEKGSFLYAGQLAENKGLKVLIDEFALALQKNKKLHLNIAGTGALEQELKHQVKQLDIEESVTFLGWVNVHDHLHKAGAFIMPSIIMENCSIAIEEAMMSVRPVIASNRGGNPWLIEDGKQGAIFDPLKKGDLAKALLEYAKIAQVKKAGKQAYAKIQEISNLYQEQKKKLY